MRWILIWTMPQVQDQSQPDDLQSGALPLCYGCPSTLMNKKSRLSDDSKPDTPRICYAAKFCVSDIFMQNQSRHRKICMASIMDMEYKTIPPVFCWSSLTHPITECSLCYEKLQMQYGKKPIWFLLKYSTCFVSLLKSKRLDPIWNSIVCLISLAYYNCHKWH